MYANILLPTDGLGKCQYGTCHGVLLARNLGARITAVCVTEKYSIQEILEIFNSELPFGLSAGVVERRAIIQAKDLHKELAGSALAVAEKMCAENGVKVRKGLPRRGIPHGRHPEGGEGKEVRPHLHIDPRQPGVDGGTVRDVGVEDPVASKIPVLVHHCGGPS